VLYFAVALYSTNVDSLMMVIFINGLEMYYVPQTKTYVIQNMIAVYRISNIYRINLLISLIRILFSPDENVCNTEYDCSI
jgi:hypothetical protein